MPFLPSNQQHQSTEDLLLIVKHFFQTLTTNAHSAWPCGHFADQHFTTADTPQVNLAKGELFGDFNLGSTIVLLFEAPDSFEFAIRPGQRVKYGQGIGTTTD